MKKQIGEFKSVTIFILATNETESLRKTISNIISLSCYDDIEEIVIVVKNETCPACFEMKNIISENPGLKLLTYVQKSECVEKCLAEIPLLVKSSHFIIMVADGEMDPGNIDTFVAKAKKQPERIICASKWHKDSVVKGYGCFKEFASRAMNTFIGILFQLKVTDPFSIYQIYPLSVYNRLRFDNPKTFVYEYTVKALRNDVEYEEIPTVYNKRSAGKSHFRYGKLFQTAIFFCITAIRIRVLPKNNSNI